MKTLWARLIVLKQMTIAQVPTVNQAAVTALLTSWGYDADGDKL